jgi:hypothetical protein
MRRSLAAPEEWRTQLAAQPAEQQRAAAAEPEEAVPAHDVALRLDTQPVKNCAQQLGASYRLARAPRREGVWQERVWLMDSSRPESQ